MVRTKPDSKQQGSHMLWRQCGVWTCLSALVAGWLLLGMALPGVAQQRPRGSGAEATASTAGNGYVGAPPVARHQFVVGEKLVYGVRVTVPSLGLRDAPVARFSTEVAERGTFYGREGLRLLVRAETIGFVKATLFDLDDRFVTYLDPMTRLPYRAEADLKEGKRVERTVIVFDQSKRTAEINSRHLVKLTGDTYDLAGLLWTVRNLDFEKPTTVKLSALSERSGTIVTVEVELLARETIEVAGQPTPVVQLALRPLDSDGKPSDERKLRMWITDDANRYVVRITGGNELGEFRAELVRFPNQGQTVTSQEQEK